MEYCLCSRNVRETFTISRNVPVPTMEKSGFSYAGDYTTSFLSAYKLQTINIQSRCVTRLNVWMLLWRPKWDEEDLRIRKNLEDGRLGRQMLSQSKALAIHFHLIFIPLWCTLTNNIIKKISQSQVVRRALGFLFALHSMPKKKVHARGSMSDCCFDCSVSRPVWLCVSAC
jgi:hypothetical protein